MTKYVERYRTVIQWSEDDNAYVAAIPALPGCMADGETREQALQNLNDTAELWIAKAKKLGRDVPEPERELLVAR